jgi:hypothetical protein
MSIEPIYINIGGLIAMGFDATGKYLLTVSHSGQGVYSTDSWQKVGRSDSVVYPENGVSVGIAPIENERITVAEKNYETGELSITTPDNRFILHYHEGIIEIRPAIT